MVCPSSFTERTTRLLVFVCFVSLFGCVCVGGVGCVGVCVCVCFHLRTRTHIWHFPYERGHTKNRGRPRFFKLAVKCQVFTQKSTVSLWKVWMYSSSVLQWKIMCPRLAVKVGRGVGGVCLWVGCVGVCVCVCVCMVGGVWGGGCVCVCVCVVVFLYQFLHSRSKLHSRA